MNPAAADYVAQLATALQNYQRIVKATEASRSLVAFHEPNNRKLDKLMEKDFATMMGKQVLTGNVGSENEAYTWFNTAEHAKLTANGVPLDHERVVLWIASSIPSNTPAGKWWAHRLETIAAVVGTSAVAAVAAVVGPPAIAAVPA